jgi:extracellular elastinolytic metalloproteinase
MVVLNKLFSSVLLAILYATYGNAAPWPVSSKHATHRTRIVGRGLKLETFNPETKYQTFAKGKDITSLLSGDNDVKTAALSFVKSELSIDDSTVSFKSSSAEGSTSYAYLKQSHENIPFANAVANVAMKDNKVVAFGSSFVDAANIASSSPSIDVAAAIAKAEEALDGKHNDIEPTLEYLVKSDGSIALTHVVQVQNDEAFTFQEAFVDAHSGEILSVTDFINDAAYTVLPITKETLPEGQETLTDPQDLEASPFGWHSDGANINTTSTAGNNVIAFKANQAAVTNQSSPGLIFDYKYDDTVAPTAGQNVDAARTNAFYVMNTVHDIAYRYGFTEASFNFQSNNFGKGGAQNDRVLMSVQDGSGTNNANFGTPPDGQSGTCRMFIWTLTTVRRDGSLENDIPVHEMTHGISNRLTGGGTARCLQTLEAGGMGEGWSDAMAEWTEQKDATIRDYVMGQYVTNDPAGIRNFPYSTSSTTNALTYASIAQLNEVHNIGEVWANMLHNVYAALVTEHGFSTTAHTDPSGSEGNVVFLNLFITGLKLQPCNPILPTARDAWIQADENLYDGVHVCLLWKAFASRGLGVGAANHVNSNAVPAECS